MTVSAKLSAAVILLAGGVLMSCRLCDGGKYAVLKAPSNVHFDPQGFEQAIPVSDIPLIMLATFGYHPLQEMQWKGLYQVSPFHTVNAAVLFTVVTHPDASMLPDIESSLHVTSTQDTNEVDIQEIIRVLIYSRKSSSLFFDARLSKDGQLDVFTDDSGPLANISQLNGERAMDKPLLEENGGFEEDDGLITELLTIRHVLETLKTRPQIVSRKTQDFYNFRIGGLVRVAAKHGTQSEQLKSAMQRVQRAIQEAADDFYSLYSGNAVIQLLTSTATAGSESGSSSMGTSTRLRHLLQSATSDSNSNITSSLNLAPFFSQLYPDLFNIGLWFMVVFTLIVFFVGWCMWFIDPGYDSIIYRLTTPPKMKSE